MCGGIRSLSFGLRPFLGLLPGSCAPSLHLVTSDFREGSPSAGQVRFRSTVVGHRCFEGGNCFFESNRITVSNPIVVKGAAQGVLNVSPDFRIITFAERHQCLARML
jgi:hypothetical protein